ncbi:MAG: radical SAM protein [bacterium]|nr:radical SAM protein [bacterium]
MKITQKKAIISSSVPWWLALLYSQIRENGLIWSIKHSALYAKNAVMRRQYLGTVLVEITTYCNLKCAGCYRTLNEGKGWKNRNMSIGDFQKIINELPRANTITPQGIGEPTVHPDLPEMISIAKSSGKFNEIMFTTNLMAHDIGYYSDLFKNGLSKLWISVDTLDQALADILRRGTSVEKLKTRIRELASNHPGKIGIRTVVGSKNFDSVTRIFAELDILGSLEVVLQPYDDLGDSSGCLSVDDRISLTNYINNPEFSFKNLTVCIEHSFIPSPQVCPAPFMAPAITADGYLTPCCRILDKDIYNFGNVISDSFDSVWNSPKTKKFKKNFTKRSPSICDGCPGFLKRE